MNRAAWLGLLAVAVGCGTTYEYSTTHQGSWLSHTWSHSSSSDQPSLGLSDEDVELALAERAEAIEVAAKDVSPAADLTLEQAVAVVEDCYAAQARDAAEQVVATHPQLTNWTESGQLVEISTGYMSSGVGGEIELTLSRREGVTGPLAVAFPPGTYGEAVAPGAVGPTESASGDAPVGLPEMAADEWNAPDAERRFKHWPKPQDLALLRAPVVVLEEGQQVASVRIPVACASFRLGPPKHNQAYSLHAFEKGSQIDSLMLALCAGDRVPAEAETQLAVWLTRDNVSWSQFESEGGHWGRLVTFGSARPVLPRHGQGAARLMLDAGLDPRGLEFFEDTGPQRLIPSGAPQEAAPAPQPEPEPEQPEPAEPAEPLAQGNSLS